MDITASMVKELRERSGVGMMECKKALTENGGDIETAMEWLRKQGLAKADKKAGRVAAEGRVAMAADAGKAAIVEVNSETDFVAKDENFVRFCDNVAKAALASGATDVDTLRCKGERHLSAKIGTPVRSEADIRAARHRMAMLASEKEVCQLVRKRKNRRWFCGTLRRCGDVER